MDLKDYLATKLSGDHQLMFMESTYMYLNKRNEFCIDLEDLMKLIGLKKKDKLKQKLIENFIENVDFKISLPTAGKQTHGGNNKETFLLTPRTFKKLCATSETPRGREVLDYFIIMEECAQEYTLAQAAHNAKVLTLQLEASQQLLLDQQAQTQLEKDRADQMEDRADQMEDRADQMERKYRAKKYTKLTRNEFIYFLKASCDSHNDTHKIGQSLEPKLRKAQFQTAHSTPVELAFTLATTSSPLAEKVIHYCLQKYRTSGEYFTCSMDYSRAIAEILCSVIDTVAGSTEAISTNELYQVVITELQQLQGCVEATPGQDEQLEKGEQPVEPVESVGQPEQGNHQLELDLILAKDTAQLKRAVDKVNRLFKKVTGSVTQVEPPVEPVVEPPAPVDPVELISAAFDEWFDSGTTSIWHVVHSEGDLVPIVEMNSKFEDWWWNQSPGVKKKRCTTVQLSALLAHKGYRTKSVNICKGCKKMARSECCADYHQTNRCRSVMVLNLKLLGPTLFS